MTETKITFGLSKCWRAISTGVLAVLLTTSAYAQIDCGAEHNLTIGNNVGPAPASLCGFRVINPTDILAPGDAATATFLANGGVLPPAPPGAPRVIYFTQIKRNNVWLPAWTPGAPPPILPAADLGTVPFELATQATINASDVGRRFEVRVIQVVPGTNQIAATCWGWVNVEDKTAPLIACPADRAVSCLQTTLPAITGNIIATANPALVVGRAGLYYDCSPSTVTYTDQEFASPCTTPFAPASGAAGPPFPAPPAGFTAAPVAFEAGGALVGLVASYNALVGVAAPAATNNIIKVIVRTFKVTDAYGNSSTCTQLIGVKRMDATMTVYPALPLTLNCADNITDFSPENLAARTTRANGYRWSAYPFMLELNPVYVAAGISNPRYPGATPIIPSCLPANSDAATIAAYILQLEQLTETIIREEVAGAGAAGAVGATVVPPYLVTFLKPGSTTCGISITYTDNDLNLCSGSFKKLRNWRLQNWCLAGVKVCALAPNFNATIELGEQTIKNLDLSEPVVKASYLTYGTTLTYVCTKDANGVTIPRYLPAPAAANTPNLATHKRDVSATQVTDALFTGETIEGTPAVISPTIQDITALGNSNSCTGGVVIQLKAKDVGCTAIGGAVTFTSSDNRLIVRDTRYDPATGETTYTLTGDFDLTQDDPTVIPTGTINNLDGKIVTITIGDACGYAKATQRFRILVIDNAKPDPVCIELLQASLGTNGTVRFQAENFNRASYDNCTNQRNLRYLVRKMRTANADGTALVPPADDCFAPFVDFNCAEAKALHEESENSGTPETIGVVMRVCDDAGNYNECMVQVLLEDKIKPTCIAPLPVTIPCNKYANLYDMSNYGNPVVFDNCITSTPVESDPIIALNNCRQGTITRTWRVENGSNPDVTCTQVITVTGVSDFTVDFPDDVVADCYADVDDDDTAKNAMLTNARDKDGHIENNGCGILAVEVSHTTPSATTDGSCYKIFRKYKVIDWCRYNPNNTNDNVNCYGRPVTGDVHRPGFVWNNAVTGNSAAWENLTIAGDPVALAAALTGTYTPAEKTALVANRTLRGNIRDRKFRDADIYNYSGLAATAAADKAAYDAAPVLPAATKAALLATSLASAAVLADAIALTYPAGTLNTAFAQNHKDHWSFGDGIICFTQTIKVVDNIQPTLTEVADNLETCDYGSAANCSAHYTKSLEGEDECQGGSSTEGLTYSWTLVREDGQPLVAAIAATATSPAVPAKMSYTGTTNKIDIPSLPYDLIYKINWTVTDRCGNASGDEYKIRFRDCKKPAITCININAEIQPYGGGVEGGQIAIWPSEVLSSIWDNCTDQAYLRSRSRIRKAGAGTGFPVTGTSVTYTCEDYHATADHTAQIEVWTQDYAGNADFCLATVTLQNNMDACGPSGDRVRINGGVQTETNANVENVTVKAKVSGTAMGNFTTTAAGTFSIAGLASGQNYTVNAERPDNILNGVTTYDIALISRHILGSETLNTPYKVIAADVNGDRDVNTADMIALRRAVLHLSPVFPNSVQSWRFINKAYTFRNAGDPLAEDFPEVVNFAAATAGTKLANFTAVKVGDVSNNATANGLAGLDIRGAAGALTLKTDDLNLVAGKTYTVQLKSDDFKVAGMQGTFNFAKGYADQISVAGQLPNMSEGNFGVFDNAVTTSWNGKASAETDVLTLTFRAKQNGKLSDVLTIGSNLTYAEAYDAAGESYSVNLSFNNGKVSGKEFALYQNEPNPFDGTTKIGFNLPESAKASLSIYDVTGKLVRIVEGNYSAGYNALIINKSDLNANGVMYYRLDSGNNTATKKMIIIE